MKIITGYQNFAFEKEKKKIPITLDSSKWINPHMLILGSSGVGKSYTLKNYIKQGVATSNATFIVYDLHGDLGTPGESVVTLSEQSPYGLNPFVVNPHPEYGGVNRAIRNFIRMVNETTHPQLGSIQEAVLRDLILDVYHNFGFDENDPETWWVSLGETQDVTGTRSARIFIDVPYKDKDKARALGAQWDKKMSAWYVATERYREDMYQWPLLKRTRRYPCLKDIYDYAEGLYQEMQLGTNEKIMAELQSVNKLAQAHRRQVIQKLKRSAQGQGNFDEEGEAKLDEAKEKLIEAVTSYIKQIETGEELRNYLKYESPANIKSVMNRLKNLLNTGIYKANIPKFDPNARVWRFDMSKVDYPVNKMIVFMHLTELYNLTRYMGETSDIRYIVVMDELGNYTSAADDKGDGIVGKIATQSRKFGLGLWTATQSPAQVPEAVNTSVATKVLLGIDSQYWKSATSKLDISISQLQFVIPKVTYVIFSKTNDKSGAKWQWGITASATEKP